MEQNLHTCSPNTPIALSSGILSNTNTCLVLDLVRNYIFQTLPALTFGVAQLLVIFKDETYKGCTSIVDHSIQLMETFC
jgi:hypothetical protein